MRNRDIASAIMKLQKRMGQNHLNIRAIEGSNNASLAMISKVMGQSQLATYNSFLARLKAAASSSEDISEDIYNETKILITQASHKITLKHVSNKADFIHYAIDNLNEFLDLCHKVSDKLDDDQQLAFHTTLQDMIKKEEDTLKYLSKLSTSNLAM